MFTSPWYESTQVSIVDSSPSRSNFTSVITSGKIRRTKTKNKKRSRNFDNYNFLQTYVCIILLHYTFVLTAYSVSAGLKILVLFFPPPFRLYAFMYVCMYGRSRKGIFFFISSALECVLNSNLIRFRRDDRAARRVRRTLLRVIFVIIWRCTKVSVHDRVQLPVTRKWDVPVAVFDAQTLTHYVADTDLRYTNTW